MTSKPRPTVSSCVTWDMFPMHLSTFSYNRGLILTGVHHGTVRAQLPQCLAHGRCSENAGCIITAEQSPLAGLSDSGDVQTVSRALPSLATLTKSLFLWILPSRTSEPLSLAPLHSRFIFTRLSAQHRHPSPEPTPCCSPNASPLLLGLTASACPLRAAPVRESCLMAFIPRLASHWHLCYPAPDLSNGFNSNFIERISGCLSSEKSGPCCGFNPSVLWTSTSLRTLPL